MDGSGKNRTVSRRLDRHGAEERDLIVKGGLRVDLSHFVAHQEMFK